MKEWMEWTERNIAFDPNALGISMRNAQPTKARMVNIVCLERHMQTRSFYRATGDFQARCWPSPSRSVGTDRV